MCLHVCNNQISTVHYINYKLFFFSSKFLIRIITEYSVKKFSCFWFCCPCKLWYFFDNFVKINTCNYFFISFVYILKKKEL